MNITFIIFIFKNVYTTQVNRFGLDTKRSKERNIPRPNHERCSL